jgi:hypothetical protein
MMGADYPFGRAQSPRLHELRKGFELVTAEFIAFEVSCGVWFADHRVGPK